MPPAWVEWPPGSHQPTNGAMTNSSVHARITTPNNRLHHLPTKSLLPNRNPQRRDAIRCQAASGEHLHGGATTQSITTPYLLRMAGYGTTCKKLTRSQICSPERPFESMPKLGIPEPLMPEWIR